jgi:PilZ domain
MEKRGEARLQPDGAIRCTVVWDKGREEGWIHNISSRGALLEASSDFGISRIQLIFDFQDFEGLGEALSLDAAIRWHAVSPQNENDHYGLVFRSLDEETQMRLERVIEVIAGRSAEP